MENINLPTYSKFEKQDEVINKQMSMIDDRLEQIEQEIEQFTSEYNTLIGSEVVQDTTHISDQLHAARTKRDNLIHEKTVIDESSFQNRKNLANQLHEEYKKITREVYDEINKMYQSCEQLVTSTNQKIVEINQAMENLSNLYGKNVRNKFKNAVEFISINENARENLRRETQDPILFSPHPLVKTANRT